MLILDATVSKSGKRIQFSGNNIMIVGAINNPKQYKFMRLNQNNSQLFIPLTFLSVGNVILYKTVSIINSIPSTLIASIKYLEITQPVNPIKIFFDPSFKFYNFFNKNSIPVESLFLNQNYKIQCIGKRKIGNLFLYVCYQY